VGVVDTSDARNRADEAGLDLVEVSPDAQPPVCRILDFGKWKYEQSKKDKANRAKSKSAELKEVRLGRSMKIDPHDVEIRLQQARRFLLEGHKVQIVQNFRGREMIHRSRGDKRMKEIIEKLSDVARVEIPPRMAGRRMTMIFAPDKVKIERQKREKLAAQPPTPADTASEPAAPETAAPETAALEPAAPETAAPETAAPETAAPEPPEDTVDESQPTEPAEA
jgi:translation initiation factor IF-3